MHPKQNYYATKELAKLLREKPGQMRTRLHGVMAEEIGPYHIGGIISCYVEYFEANYCDPDTPTSPATLARAAFKHLDYAARHFV